jgi:hypothetical protein
VGSILPLALRGHPPGRHDRPGTGAPRKERITGQQPVTTGQKDEILVKYFIFDMIVIMNQFLWKRLSYLFFVVKGVFLFALVDSPCSVNFETKNSMLDSLLCVPGAYLIKDILLKQRI